MSDTEDISRILSVVVATHQDVVKLKERVDVLDEKFDHQLVLLDGLAGKVDDMRVEYAAVSTELDRHDKWIGQLAENAELKLEW